MLPSSSAQGYIVLPFQMHKLSSNTVSNLAAGELVFKDTERHTNTHSMWTQTQNTHLSIRFYSLVFSESHFSETSQNFIQQVEIIISSFSSISVTFLEIREFSQNKANHEGDSTHFKKISKSWV